ncbi:MAG: ribosomal protein S18-alanine N-acetyltransferase [Clostridia bacterium]|nr:ribosomal protein S18-alanine N-acetyltransferase [Clostridia bacterium]
MEYKIVPLTEEHVSGIKLIDDLCFESPWSLKSFKSELSNPLAVYFVALMGEQVIGYCGYWWVFDEGQITNIAVHPDYRKMGIASKLMDEMVKKCSVTDVYSLTLEVRVSNKPAILLYEKYGFKKVGLRPKYYDNKEDALLMTKEIEQVG